MKNWASRRQRFLAGQRDRRAGSASPRRGSQNRAMALQDTVGNSALARLLTVGRQASPAGVCERKAEAAADGALSGEAPNRLADACTSCEPCREERVRPSGDAIDREHAPLPTGDGEPLSRPARVFLESRFGERFDEVRVHTDPASAASAAAIEARAYAVDNHIVFGPGEHDPDTPAGLRLIAHELAHVLQQRDRGDDEVPVVQRQPIGAQESDAPPATIPIELEYAAYDPYEDDEASIYPAMCTAMPQALGYWTHPPGSAFSDYFIPAWARQVAFRDPLGQLPNGDWLLERYAGTSSYDPRSPRTSSRVKEFFGFGLRKELYPRSFLTAEEGSSFARYTKLTPEEIKSIPDILRRVNSGGKFSYTQTELDLLHRAATAHGDSGMTGGSPFLSTTSKAGLSTEFEKTPKKFLSGRPYVVRIRVPNSAVFEMNKMPKRMPTLIPEQEMLVTTDVRGRIVAVQPNPTSSLARGEPYMRWGGRGLLALGVGVSIYRIATASEEDRGVVILHEVASHGGGLVGAGLGASGCVVFGVATGGVVLFACGFVGAFLGAEAASNLVMAPFLYADVLVNVLPNLALAGAEGVDAVGKVAGVLPDSIASGPAWAHAMVNPGNWDMRYFPPAIAPDVAAVGIAMWERLGPLQIDDFIQQMSKPVGSFGVPVESARRIAAFLSGPDKQYNANMPALYASAGTVLPPSPAEPGINILDMKPWELVKELAARRLTFVQDPNILAGYANRVGAEPISELRLRPLVEKRERIAEDNWGFPGKSHDQVRALRYVGQQVWNVLKPMDDRDLDKNIDRALATFGISEFAFKDATRALSALWKFSGSDADLSDAERAQHEEALAEFARAMRDMTPDDYVNSLIEHAGLVHIKPPGPESYEAIRRVKAGLQPW